MKKVILSLVLLATLVSCSTPEDDSQISDSSGSNQRHIVKVSSNATLNITLNGVNISNGNSVITITDARPGDTISVMVLCMGFSNGSGVYHAINLYVDGNYITSRTCDLTYIIP